MLFKKSLWAVLSVMLLSANTVMAQNTEKMLDFWIEMLKSNGELKLIANCAGSTEQKVEAQYRSAIGGCTDKHGISGEAVDQCIETQMQAVADGLGLTEERYEACGGDLAEESEDYDDAPYDPEAEAERARQEMQFAQNMMAAASEGTLDRITLPVYPDSEVTFHNPQGVGLGDGSQSLPYAKFSSQDSVDQILAFYREELPDFDVKDLGYGTVVIMETIPENFKAADVRVMQTTPHVSITQAAGQEPGVKALIEILYEPR